jgi:hypothetical protein
MATSTLLRPPEVPPFSLKLLVEQVFAPGQPAVGTSTPPRPGFGARFNQFVAAPTATTSPQGKGKEKAPVIRLAEAAQNSLWVGSSDGSIKEYQTTAESADNVKMFPGSRRDLTHLADIIYND